MAENLGASFSIDISQLKKGLQTANKLIRESETEFKAAAAGMQDWTKSQEGLEKKLQSLNEIADLQKKKVDALKTEYNRLINEGLDPSSDKAIQLRTQINRETEALEKSKQEINRQQTALEALQRSSSSAEQATQSLTQKVKDQESQLKDLKQRYIDTAAAQGDSSTEAQDLARQISELSGELRDNQTRLREAESAADNFDQSLEDVGDEAESTTSGGLSAFAVALGNLAANVIANLLGKMKELATQTIEVGKSFDTSMSKVEAVSGASAEEVEKLRDKAKEMGASTKFSASEAADAFNFMAMAGWKTEDMLGGIEGILNLAAASGSDLATTSDIVTDALTAMGYSAKDAGRLADVMAAASSNANTNVEMMGQTFKYAAPVVGALGYDMEDTAVAIGLMANAGIKADQAGTSLRSILTRLSAPPKECAEEMEKLGLSMTDSEGNMKTLDQVIQDLRKAFDGMSETEQTAAAKHIAGAEAMSGLLSIVNAAPEDFDKLTKAVEGSEGAAAKMAETIEDNLGGDATKAKSNLESLQLMIYEKLEPALRKGVKAINKMIDVFKWIIKNGAPIAAAITGVATAVGVFMAIINKSAIMTAFTTGLTAIKTAFTGLWAVMAANPVGLIVAAIAGLVAAFVVLWNKSEAFRDFFIGIWESIKAAVMPVLDGLVQWVQDMWVKLQPVIEVIKEYVTVMLTEAVAMFEAAWAAIKAIWDFVAPYFMAIWEAIKEIWSAVSETLGGYFSEAWAKIQEVWAAVEPYFRRIFNNIKKIFSAVGRVLGGYFKMAWKNIKVVWDLVVKYFQTIWDNIKLIFNVVEKVFKGDFEGAWNAIKQIWNNVVGYFRTVWNGIKKIFANVIEFFKTTFSAAWDAIKAIWDTVKAYYAGIWAGIKQIFAPVINWFKDIFAKAWNAIKAVWNFVIGYFQGIWDGIKSVFKSVVYWFKGTFSNAWEAIKTVWNAVTGFFTGIWTGIKKVFSQTAEWFKGIFTKAWENIKSTWNAATGFFSNVWNGITGIFGNVSGWFRNKFLDAWGAIKSIFSWDNVYSFFDNVWNTIKGIFTNIGSSVGTAVGGAFKQAINWAIDTIEDTLNFLPRKVNGVLQNVTDLTGVSVPLFPYVNLPRLAKGGVVRRATNAIIGEDGAEAVVPLEHNTQWIDQLADKLADKIGSGGVVVNQTNNYSQAHSRYEIYKSQQATAAAVKLALAR
ncbi:MAG: phage tail tape measure protein [Prevotella sp.]|nr:phage tail tape measure protein [Prevotella sp.]